MQKCIRVEWKKNGSCDCKTCQLWIKSSISKKWSVKMFCGWSNHNYSSCVYTSLTNTHQMCSWCQAVLNLDRSLRVKIWALSTNILIMFCHLLWANTILQANKQTWLSAWFSRIIQRRIRIIVKKFSIVIPHVFMGVERGKWNHMHNSRSVGHDQQIWRKVVG